MVSDDLTNLAHAILRLRRARARDLPAELFGGERAWDIMLALFVADAQGTRLTGAGVLATVQCPRSIGKRWLDYLDRQQLIVGDGSGHLDDPLMLTPSALQAVENWLATARVELAG